MCFNRSPTGEKILKLLKAETEKCRICKKLFCQNGFVMSKLGFVSCLQIIRGIEVFSLIFFVVFLKSDMNLA